MQDDVLAARQLAVEAEAELEKRRDAPAHDDAPVGGRRTRAMTRKSVLFPAPFGPMIPTRSPGRDREGDVAEREELAVVHPAPGASGSRTP